MLFPSARELSRGAERATGQTGWETGHSGTPFEALELLAGARASGSGVSRL